jgi:hypothetical protein
MFLPFLIRIISLLCLLSFATFSFAESQYKANYGTYWSPIMGSADAACADVRTHTSSTYTGGYAHNPSGESGACIAQKGTSNYALGTWTRLAASNAGNACVGESGATGIYIINSAGDCVDYTRADLPSQCKSWANTSGTKVIYVGFDGDGNPLTPPPISAGGCEAIAYDVAHCTMAPKRIFPTGGSIQPTSNKCRVGVRFTGNTLAGGSAGPAPSDGPGDDGVCTGDCPPLDPAPIDNDTKPCTYVYDGEGRKVCSSSNFNYSPGNSSCGTVNGTFQCVGKSPTTNGITIDTTVTDTTNPDGSSKSVKKDTATVISCTGANACNAKTTTNTTTTTYNSNGAKTGQSSSCVGDACSKDGKDDSDGDGLSDCAFGTCEEEEGFTGPENDEVPGFGDSLGSFMDSVQGSPLVSAATNAISIPSGGSCSFQSFNVPILGTLSFQPVCAWAAEWLGPLRYLMLAIWAIVAVRTFLEA